MPTKSYPEEVLKYPGEWVALAWDDDRFVSHAKTPKECLVIAQDAGFQILDVTLLYVPEDLWQNIRI